jgi:hypothetical protein
MHARFIPIDRDNGLSDPAWWYWCPSLVRGDNGRWHLFASRWPRHLPMHPGWLVASEVVRAEAERPEGPFGLVDVVLPARGPQWWDGRMTHNPRVVRDGSRWLLFYTGSTHPFADPAVEEDLPNSDPRVLVARSRKRIGIAVADQPEGPWRRLPAPIVDVRPGHFDSLLTSNPAPLRRADGSWFMVYKARGWTGSAAEPQHGRMVLGVAVASDPLRPWERACSGPIFASEMGELEDPFVWGSGRGIEMLAKDMSGRCCGVPRGGFRAWSADTRIWQPDEMPLAHDRRIRWSDGEVQQMGAMERATYLIQDGRATHLVAAVADGPEGVVGAQRAWNVVIPLR